MKKRHTAGQIVAKLREAEVEVARGQSLAPQDLLGWTERLELIVFPRAEKALPALRWRRHEFRDSSYLVQLSSPCENTSFSKGPRVSPKGPTADRLFWTRVS